MASTPITMALARVAEGEQDAQGELLALVYNDLKRLAAGRLQRMRSGQTLQATALVHEAWMRLDQGAENNWETRAHFFGAAANAMRNILVDQARKKAALRNNAGKAAGDLPADLAAADDADTTDILALSEALEEFSKDYERPARIISLRYFTGLSAEEIAKLLSVTKRTIERELVFARTWLKRRIG